MSDPSRAEDLVSGLCSGLRHRMLYFEGHPEVRTCSDQVARALHALLGESGKDLFFLGAAHGRLLHEGRYLIGSTILGRRLVELLQRLHSGGLLLRAGLEAAEVAALFEVSVLTRGPTEGLEASRALLRERNVRHIELSPPYEDVGWFGQFLYDRDEGGGVPAGGDAELAPIYQSLFDTVDVTHGRAASGTQIDVDGARGTIERLLGAANGSFTDILRLVRYPDYDAYTVGHSVRVALLSVMVGQRLGAEPDFLIELGAAGLLHDVGKARIPEAILYKTGPLDADERRTVSQHARLGAQILLEQRGASPLAVAAAFGHHLRNDRRGYPETRPWAVSHRVTSLIQVCDVFEALTAVRPYKPALTPRCAYEIMLSESGSYDPGALRAFVSALGLYPPGSRVQLSGGERALVLAAGDDLARPLVQITHAASGDEIPVADRPVLDLGSPQAARISVANLLLESRAAA
ncbi:MAG: HD domain-containing protein [Deltaproteobacteria bacterium]|nr:HD domain-containing protein [Deltaproteobacteria bacterium]